jgi:hypothetical protein
LKICYSVISEGGYNPDGNVFTANNGSNVKIINNLDPLLAIRLKSNGNYPKMIIRLLKASVMSSSNANAFVQLVKFQDTNATTALTGSSFQSVHPESGVEYDVSATAIDMTNAIPIDSSYFSNNNDQLTFKNTKSNFISTNINGVSDLLVLVVETVGGNESYVGSLTFRELI